jgi:hypothetical protein
MSKPIAGSLLSLLMGMNIAQAQAPAAAPADVASPNAIVQAVYSVISGPKGVARDWPRLRSLMAPGALFAVTGAGKTGALRTRVLSVEEFISGSTKGLANDGFYEHGAIGPIWRYAHIAAVQSPYESRRAPGEPPFQRGINSFQLSYDGARWWIVSIAWEAETADFPLPKDADALLHAK